MKQIIIHLGFTKDRDGEYLDYQHAEEHISILERALAKKLGGFSRNTVQGAYVNDAGLLMKELSYRYELIAETQDDVVPFFRVAARHLDQESFLMQVSDVAVSFVKP